MSLKIFSTEWFSSLISKGSLETTATTKTMFQTKTLGANTTAVGQIADLTFNNVEAGKTYRATIVGLAVSTTGEDPSLEIRDSLGTTIGFLGVDSSVTGTIISYFSHSTAPFKPTVAGQVYVYKRNATGYLGAGAKLTLEELPNHEVTTAWT